MKRNLGGVGQVSASEPNLTRHKEKKFKNVKSKKAHLKSGKFVDGAISKIDNRLLANMVVQRNQRFNKQLSPVELENARIPGNVADVFYSSDGAQKRR